MQLQFNGASRVSGGPKVKTACRCIKSNSFQNCMLKSGAWGNGTISGKLSL